MEWQTKATSKATSTLKTDAYHTKQLNPWPYSSASHVVNYSQLSACQRRWSHLEATQALMYV